MADGFPPLCLCLNATRSLAESLLAGLEMGGEAQRNCSDARRSDTRPARGCIACDGVCHRS